MQPTEKKTRKVVRLQPHIGIQVGNQVVAGLPRQGFKVEMNISEKALEHMGIVVKGTDLPHDVFIPFNNIQFLHLEKE